ncbi:MAG: hypothetical protein WCX23_01455 [Candidatus Paceibacterota bacterium]|jgi:hypothetical protein|nr:hypothetical protein [Candidatus Paceibacterota bacterium]MDD4830559.1 hypothetical protein [Candidatus Paceibacterota bacterium]MDD4874935.1 hypothetical protein [Candidatus Paceibacterota bacterium]
MNKILIALILTIIVLSGGIAAVIVQDANQASISHAVEVQKVSEEETAINAKDISLTGEAQEDGTIIKVSFQAVQEDIFGKRKIPFGGPFGSDSYLTINPDGTYEQYEVYEDGYTGGKSQGKWSWAEDKQFLNMIEDESLTHWKIETQEIRKYEKVN